MRWAALASLLALACAKPAWQVREVPPPGTSMPGGLLVVSVDVGSTQSAAILVESTGYVARRNPITSNGVYTLRLNPGDWRISVVGIPATAPTGVRFGDEVTTPVATGDRETHWPVTPMPVTIVRNRLTNAGQLCAHTGCAQVWTPFEHPRLREWEDAGRYVEAVPPPEEEAPTPDEPADK